jgi:predicted DNA-binding protein YlxM (UPF0122 family)
MEVKDRVLSYVESYYPMDYELAGKANTIQIIDSVFANKAIEIVTSEQGSNFDVVASLEVIALVVETVKAVLEIVQYFHEKKEKVTLEKIKKELVEKLSKSGKKKMEGEELEQLIREMIEYQNRD